MTTFAMHEEMGRKDLDRGTPGRKCGSPAAFSLTELLVVIAILTLLASTQLPALTRAKVPMKYTQCLNNLRQIGYATLLYKDENNDAYPFGNRVSGPGVGSGSVLDLSGWPMQLLRYLGGYVPTNQPRTYICPSESGFAANWAFQVHYTANRYLLSDVNELPQAILGSHVRKPSQFWMFIEKSPFDYCNMRSGSLANPILFAWNYPPGSPQLRRHNGGTTSVAADGHIEWLRMPLYRPGAPPPSNFVELGDCANGSNPGSTWVDGPQVKLFTRYQQVLGADAF
jgi:prepilin-type N-terminal cleavage/methylation domain-containing protein